MAEKVTGLARLMEPFDAHHINTLPKPYKADSPKGKCGECGGYHGLPAVHLDYVGHAALTSRLLEVDPEWTYKITVTDPVTGAPILDANGGMWIELTVCGVTRPGYGDAQGKRGGNAIKEAIGDALRNAAMRFGAALDLWHKGDLHDASVERGDDAAPEVKPVPAWRARVAAAKDVDALTAIHSEAVAGGWATPDLMSALSARKKALTP